MVQYIFTPWRDRRELLGVRRQFYPNGDGETRAASPEHEAAVRAAQHAAVARVAVWMQRGYCPHMVESTALLMAAILSDGGDESSAPSSSPSPSPATTTATSRGSSAAYAARATYAAAFSRFVTGLLDGQQDRARKLSMHGLAQTVGLPPGFVELRHQATHEALPALRRLRAASRQALAWIWGYYWAHMEGLDVPETGAAKESADAEATMEDVHREEEGSDNDALRHALLEYIDHDDRNDSDTAIQTFVIAQWGEARVLAALSAISTEETGDSGDGVNGASSVSSVAGSRALRCIRLSRKVLQHKEQKAETASSEATAATEATLPKPRTRTRAKKAAAARAEQATANTAKAESKETPKPWTMATLNLDAMRAAMAQSRQALYQAEEEKDAAEAEEGEGDEDEQLQKRPEGNGAEKDGANGGDVVMAEEAAPEAAPEAVVVEPESRLPARQPRWSRYAGEWTPRPIGVVL
ncbi:rRNA-processing protein las1 [Sporothrix curviconia]|uniref:rRNA-processing protein las1 n=1 Tax=Sporothrix curviconia TaxID=1260050 RepID=A0ABP0BXX9_9PEZI